MSLSLALLPAFTNHIKAQFIDKTQCVAEAQERFLMRLLKAHQKTALGKELNLEAIRTVEQFRDRVPILSYEAYVPYVERIAAGEKAVLNPAPVNYINLTSGSTGNKKLVPVTQPFQASLRRADITSLGFLLEALQRQGLKFGKSMVTNSIQLQGMTSGGIEYGPVSVGSLRKGKFWFEHIFSLPYESLLILDTLARHYICLLFALSNANLRGMTANFPMLILRTCSYLEDYAEELINSLKTGTIPAWVEISPELRHILNRELSAHPQRAAQLQAILQTAGRLTPQLAWPNLSYICTARGGTSDFYFERFSDYFGDIPIFGGVYGTAEGTFGIFPDVNTDGSILALESSFFEFIPADQWDTEQPKTLLPQEVQVGERYRILVTSYSGFYRYDIGDVVEVTGFYNQTPMIVFRHRRGGLLSSTTEKTTEFHVTQVMKALQQEFDLQLEDFCITLSEQEFPSPYLVNIELAGDRTLSHPLAFLARFEYWMQEVNSPYGTVRQGQVPPPRLRVLAPGSFAIVRQRQINRGMFDSQLKIPHISEDRSFLSGLIVEQEIQLALDTPIDLSMLSSLS
ncbi:MAG TPA: GH3 auxin-responsive promoter family protein [Coleofasciculaceae cyanobacterium]